MPGWRHSRRQMGRDLNRRRPPVSAPPPHRREEVLALRLLLRAASPVRGRTATTADRGGADRRYGFVELLGGIRSAVSLDPVGLPRTRKGQDRTQGADAGGRQGGVRP